MLLKKIVDSPRIIFKDKNGDITKQMILESDETHEPSRNMIHQTYLDGQKHYKQYIINEYSVIIWRDNLFKDTLQGISGMKKYFLNDNDIKE